MATGKSGHFELNTSKSNVKVRVNWSETYDAAANTSKVSIDSVQVKALSPYGYYGYTYYPEGSISVNGSTVVTFKSATPTHKVQISTQDAWYSISGSPYVSGNIAHDTNGAKSVTLAINITGYSASGDGDSGWSVSSSQTIALTTIPRASTIGATDANVGATSVIAVSRKSSNYTHSIAFKFGSLSGYINDDGEVVSSEVKMTATNIAFPIPTSWYNQMADSPTKVCTLTCKTYSGSTQIGTSQTASFTVTAAPSSSAPTVSGTVKDVNSATVALTGDSNKLIRYFSNAQCTISATAKNGASIVEKRINDTVVSGNTLTIEKVESGTFVFAAEDSRRYTSQVAVTKTIVNYIPLTATVTCTRPDPTSGNATLTAKGNFFKGSFGSKSNTLTIKYKVGSGSWVTVSSGITYSNNTYQVTVSLSGMDYQTQYSISVTIADSLQSLTRTATLKKGIPLAHWGKDHFTIEELLRAYGGLDVAMSKQHTYYSESDNDESKLNTWLNTQLSQMPERSARMVIIACYPAVSGPRICGILYKDYTADNAVLYGASYGGYGTFYTKAKLAGVWYETRKLTGSQAVSVSSVEPPNTGEVNLSV